MHYRLFEKYFDKSLCMEVIILPVNISLIPKFLAQASGLSRFLLSNFLKSKKMKNGITMKPEIMKNHTQKRENYKTK